MQKEKEEAKHCYERMEKDKLKIESQLEDTSTQVPFHQYLNETLIIFISVQNL